MDLVAEAVAEEGDGADLVAGVLGVVALEVAVVVTTVEEWADHAAGEWAAPEREAKVASAAARAAVASSADLAAVMEEVVSLAVLVEARGVAVKPADLATVGLPHATR